MAGLQRSAVSFRRQGSSGLIWDDKLFSGDLKRNSEGIPIPPLSDGGNQDQNQTAIGGNNNESNDQSKCSKTAIGSINTVRRSRSNNGGGGGTEPPSPRVPVCGFCSAFGKTNKNQRRIGASRKRSFA